MNSIIYHYGADRALKGKSKAKVIRGEVIVPAEATTIEPPETKKNQIAVYDEAKGLWRLVEDYRGSTVWSKDDQTSKTIENIGPVPEEFTDLEPLPFSVWSDDQWVYQASLHVDHLKVRLMSIVDGKHQDAYSYILGHKATDLQLERYKDKYERAMVGEFDAETNRLIIQKHQATLAKIRSFTDLIEVYRQKTDEIIEAGAFERAESALSASEQFSSTTTLKDIEAL